MAFTPKVLAEGQLPTTKTTLYTAPGATAVYVHNIKLYNTNAATQTVLIYVKPASTSRTITRISLQQNWSAEVIDQPIQLEAGDIIEGETTTATAVDYVITGVEST